MTWRTLQEHEAMYLPYFQDDYRRRSLEAMVERFVTGRTVLEMRCINGHLTVALAKRGFEVKALDGYKPAVEITNRRARDNGIGRDLAMEWDFQDLRAPAGTAQYDTILCLDTLNHAPDDSDVMRQIVEAMKDGGRLVISAPAHPSLHGKRDDALGHLRRYSRKQMETLLTRHGLEVVMIRPWNFLALPAYILIEKILRRRVSEGLRLARAGRLGGNLPNQALRWWYTVIENRLWFPCGLSWIVIARKGTKGAGNGAAV